MGQAILIRDREGVISVWEKQGRPMWSLWETKTAPTFSCSEENEGERRAMLIEYLDIIKSSGTVCDYTIKFHDEVAKSGKINNNTPIFGSLCFKLNEDARVVAREAGGGAPAGIAMMNELFAAKLENLEAKWERKMQDLEREHDEEIRDLEDQLTSKPKGKIDGVLGALGEVGTQYPIIGDIIKDWSTVLKHKFMQAVGPGPSRQPAASMAGVTDPLPSDQRVSAAIKVMASYYVGKHGYFADGISEEDQKAANLKGWKEFADDMTLLAGLTSDPDIMELALKKLRQMA